MPSAPGLLILIISPQPWEGLQVSKHHYAAELARLGHDVYFLNPPSMQGSPGAVRIAPAADQPRIRVVDYRPWLPYRLKFHLRRMFDVGMRRQARLIIRAIGREPDLVWDFDNAYQFTDLKAFGAKASIFHLVDETVAGRTTAKQADIMFGLANTMFERIQDAVPQHLIPHGVGRHWTEYARRVVEGQRPGRPCPRPVHVGYAGNLAHVAIDRDALRAMLTQQPDVLFNFISPTVTPARGDHATAAWLSWLQAQPNCVFHFGRGADYIVELAERIDVWLVCYDLARDINRGANSHKIGEYLATGAPILSSWIAAFEGTSLVRMAERGSNRRMPEMLCELINDLSFESSSERRSERAGYALDNSYEKHVATISRLLGHPPA